MAETRGCIADDPVMKRGKPTAWARILKDDPV
jgi:hypothetical protein